MTKVQVEDGDLRNIINTAHRTRDMLELLAAELQKGSSDTEDPITLLKAGAESLNASTRPFRYRWLRERGVLTVNDVIAQLQMLPEDEKAQPLLMPKGNDDWQYIEGVAKVGSGNEYIMPTLLGAEQPFDNRDA